MGQHSGNQDRLFYSFNLDTHVPADHLLRGIDRFLDLGDLRQHLARAADGERVRQRASHATFQRDDELNE